MKPPLEKTDLRYLRRLVREINRMLPIKSVYARDYPFFFRVQSVCLGPNIKQIIATEYNGKTQSFGPDDFFADGARIVASQEAV